MSKNEFYVFVAVEGEKVIGGLTAYWLQQYYSTKALVYIYDLAVKESHSRLGIATRLVAALANYVKGSGVEEMFVQADEADDHALEF